MTPFNALGQAIVSVLFSALTAAMAWTVLRAALDPMASIQGVGGVVFAVLLLMLGFLFGVLFGVRSLGAAPALTPVRRRWAIALSILGIIFGLTEVSYLAAIVLR